MLDVERKTRKSKTPRLERWCCGMDVNIRLTADARIKAGTMTLANALFFVVTTTVEVLGSWLHNWLRGSIRDK
jgi:hypothetical protein